jgi:hypothetical protein
MVASKSTEAGAVSADRHRLPPVTELAVITMVLVLTGGIYVAAYLPQRVSLALPVILLVAATVFLLANIVALCRLREFAWHTFFIVGGWAVLAYAVIAGVLEYVFVLDETPRSLLLLLTATLAVFAVDVPLLFAFSVARYQATNPTPDR